jgi:hypothetical protein
MILWPLQHSHSLYTFIRPLTQPLMALSQPMASVDSLTFRPLLRSHGLYMTSSGPVHALSCIHTNPKASNGIPAASACTLMANTSPLLLLLGAHLRPLESLSIPLSSLSRPTKQKYVRFGAIKSLQRSKIMVLRQQNRCIASKLIFK